VGKAGGKPWKIIVLTRYVILYVGKRACLRPAVRNKKRGRSAVKGVKTLCTEAVEKKSQNWIGYSGVRFLGVTVPTRKGKTILKVANKKGGTT